MKSFSSNIPNRANLNVQTTEQIDNSRQVNNYESVEYEATKYRPVNNHYNAQERDTVDLYSYQDNNNIYVEDDEDIKPASKCKAPSVDYIKVTPYVDNNDSIKYAVDLNDLRNHLGTSVIPTISQTLNRLNPGQQIFTSDNLGLNPTLHRINKSTLPNQLHHHQQHQQNIIYQKSIDSQSLMPTLNRVQNNSVIVNQPQMYQKSIDNMTLQSYHQLEMVQNQQQPQSQHIYHDKSIDSQSIVPTINRSVYNYSSKTQLNKTNISGESAQKVVSKTNSNDLQATIGFCKFFCAFFCFFFKCFRCLTSCLLKPCCSTAAILGGFICLGILIISIAFAGVLGLLPIPNELTKNICSMDRHKTWINYNDNQTAFNMSNRVLENKNNNNTSYGIVMTANNSTNLTNALITLENSVSNAKMKKKTLFKKKLIKTQINLKKKSAKIVPLQYDVTLMPTFPETNETKTNIGIEMRISLSIKLYCYNSTNMILLLNTREIFEHELRFEIISNEENIKVLHWSQLVGNVLQIQTSKNLAPNNFYQLNAVFVFKNYVSLGAEYSKAQQQFQYLSFYDDFEHPFPVVIENEDEIKRFLGPSIFNITWIKPKYSQILISNMEISNVNEIENMQFVNYKTTPFVPVQTISFVLGKLSCRRDDDEFYPIKLQICSPAKSKDFTMDSFDIIIDYIKKLMDFFHNYTKVQYVLKKLDVVILPSESIIELANDDQSLAQLGIIYLPQFYVKSLKTSDSLEKSQVKLKVVHIISKQLSKHWFYKYQECNNQMNLFKDLNENDFTVDTLYLIKSLCAENNNLTFCSNKDPAVKDKSFDAFLQYNVNCYLFKGIVNWLSYLSFKSIHPDLVDLVFLEWSLIRELDETYFFSDSNIKYIYQAYDFPRLTESNSLQKIKTEIKGLLSVRTISLLFGKDRFQSFILEWFSSIQSKSNATDHKVLSYLNQTTKTGPLNIDLNSNSNENSILELLQMYSDRNNIISFPKAMKVKFRDVIQSWILAPTNVILSMNRNYNKKDAAINLDYSNNSIINDVYFPLNWLSGTYKTSDDRDRNVNTIQLTDEESFNVKWINQSKVIIRDLPGADKWVIGNYMKMFGELRVNYDEQNWMMLINQLLFDYKTLNVNDRVQIIDDAFYLANNQRMSISIALNILKYIPKEDNFLPWKYAIKNVKTILNYIEDDSQVYSKFRNYLISSFNDTYEKLKWGESMTDTMDEKLIRILVVDLLCSLDYQKCVKNSHKQLIDSISINVYNIPQYLSKSIYCTAIRYGGITEWLYLWDYYLMSEDSNVKDSLLYSLSCSSHIWILNLFLRKLVYENSIPVENLPIVFDYISQNPVGKYITWNHISQNYQEFYNKIGNDPDLFLKILQVSTKELKFKYEIKQFYDFIEEIGSKNITFYYSKNNKDKLLSNIESRINKYAQWKDSNVNALNEWLNQNKVPEIQNSRSSDL